MDEIVRSVFERRLEREAGRTRLAVHFEVTCSPASLSNLGADVADALVGAVAEALRNVERHAAVREAQVVVREAAGVLTVEVRDHGVGAGPGGAQPGFGITESIGRRLDDVGGRGVVHFAESGTTVTLSWPTPRTRMGRQAMLDSAVAASRAAFASPRDIVLVGVAVMVSQSVLALRHFRDGGPALVQIATMVALGLLTLAVLRTLVLGRVRIGGLIAVSLLAPAIAFGAIAASGDGAVGTFASWQNGYASVPLTLLAFFVPLRLLPLLVLPLVAAMSALTALDPTVDLGEAWPALNSCSFPLIGGLMGTMLRRSSRRVQEQLEARAGHRSSAAHDALVEAARARFLRRIEADVVPWLNEIATGVRSLGDPALAGEAAALGAGVRDDLYVPELLADDLAVEVARFRRAGGRIDFRPDVGAQDRAEHVRHMVWLVLAEVATSHQIRVSPHSLGLRMAISPGLIPEARERLYTALGGAEMEFDEFATVFTWSGPPDRGVP